jgi:tight adherence protein B
MRPHSTRAGSLRRAASLALAGAVLAVLSLPAAAIGQGEPKLKSAPDNGFPDRQYLLQLPSPRTLESGDVRVTENGAPPSGAVGVEAPGSGTSGAVLLIDASQSMRGKPIQQAMQAARAFLKVRNPEMPVAVVAYNPEQHVLTDFTTDSAALDQAVATTPQTVFGTEIYDSLITASEMAKDHGLKRATAVLLSDGQELSSESGVAEALAALDAANMRVIAVGFKSSRYQPARLEAIANGSGGTFVPTASADEFVPVFEGIGRQLASEYLVTYRSVLPPQVPASVTVTVSGLPPATAKYTTPELVVESGGTFNKSWVDDVITSPFLMVFVVLSVLALLVFAVLTGLDVRSRSVRKRMAQYVSVPTEDESRQRRAEVTAMLAERAQRRVEGHRWWQSFERDVELAGFKMSAVTIAGWTVLAMILTSLVVALVFQSLLGLFAGLVVPLITRMVVKRRVSSVRSAFAEELPDNLEVLAGALRAGHSLIGAMGVMVDGATEPSKSEFRRVLQDEQLGVPLDEALMVMAGRMDNLDVEQVAIVTRLQREAGGNTAEVLDRVVENIRGRMELRRLVRVLTAQGRIARYILTAIPIVLLIFFFTVNPVWLEPLWQTGPGRFALGTWVVLLISGWFAIKKIVEIEV